MNRRRTLTAFVIISCFVIFAYLISQASHAQTAVTTISGKFYRLEVLATNGMSGITTINSSSINDFGTIAFNAPLGSGIFTADGRTPLRNIAGGNVRAPQITNNNHVIYKSMGTAANTGVIHRRDTNLPGFPLTIIAGEASSGFPDFTTINDFASINNDIKAAFSAIPTAGQTRVVTGIRFAFNQQIASPTTFLQDAFPVVADTGRVVLRTGTTATTQNIVMYQNYNLSGTPITIAPSSHFNGLGPRPGISDDGSVVVFHGVLNAAGAAANNTTEGPGIFANYDEGGGVRRTVRIARRQVENFFALTGNLDGVCDRPEQTGTTAAPPAGQPRCLDGELGLDAAGNPLQFASFEFEARVGVVRQDLAPLGSIEGDTFVVSFVGTPNAASTAPQYFSSQLGLWTVKVDVKLEGGSLREKPSRPMPVVQIGDLVEANNQVTNITIHDPIALAATDAAGVIRVQRPGDHRVVFSATTQAGGSIVVRGTRIDSDEDGLPDHWETSGIDFNQDGNPDLALNTILPGDASNLAANPNRKDIYVEMDFMQDTGPNPHTHQPGRRPDDSANLTVDPILQVRNAFSDNPVRNVDGSSGATLHTFMGEPVPEVYALQFLYQTRPTGAQDDFDDLKFGSNGATPGTPCGTGTNHGYFGTLADRGNATNCQNILGAKRLVFRYSIFAHRVSLPGIALDLTSGVAELGGNDFIVSLAVREPGTANDYEDFSIGNVTAFNATIPTPVPAFTSDNIFADFQAGTFMHELGHTLGLLHGGKDFTNFKPNYLSVMNYSRQFNVRGLSTINLPGITHSVPVLSNRRLDYAREPALRTLNEASLLENAGVNGPSGERTIHSRNDCSSLISGTDGPIDWNNNGTNEPGAIPTDVNLRRNMAMPPTCPSPSPTQMLVGSDDWSNLRYNHFETISFADGSQRRALLDGKDLDLVEILNIGLGNIDIDNDGILNPDDNCIFTPNVNQFDSNGNGIGDACDPLTTVLADLSLTMAESADPVQINTAFDYIATVNNVGPTASQNVNFNYTLPANVILNSVTASQGGCSGTSSIMCNLGTINSSSTATVTIRVTPTVRGRLDNWVSASSGGGSPTGDPNILNNTSSASTTILDSSQTFTISGRIADGSNAAIASALVAYSGGSQGAAITDANGNYSFSAISGGIYDVKPIKFGFEFSPQSRTVAYVNANQVENFVGVPVLDTAAVSDFDGDGRSDLSVVRSSDNKWYLQQSQLGYTFEPWGVAGDFLAPADFDGDGRTELGIFRPSSGEWYHFNVTTRVFTTVQWGQSGDLPFPSDRDGDGKADYVLFRPSTSTWYIKYANDLTFTSTQFGETGDKPVIGDFDGDRQFDIAVWRPSNGTWYVQHPTLGFIARQWGENGDKPVPADYDGDGKTDFAVFRPSNNTWYRVNSSDGAELQTVWGEAGDIPAPGDFDGDGRTDLVVFRPSNATWYLSRSAAGFLIQQFGQTGDVPTPSAFVY